MRWPQLSPRVCGQGGHPPPDLLRAQTEQSPRHSSPGGRQPPPPHLPLAYQLRYHNKAEAYFIGTETAESAVISCRSGSSCLALLPDPAVLFITDPTV